jgi:hypothetical protein
MGFLGPGPGTCLEELGGSKPDGGGGGGGEICSKLKSLKTSFEGWGGNSVGAGWLSMLKAFGSILSTSYTHTPKLRNTVFITSMH